MRFLCLLFFVLYVSADDSLAKWKDFKSKYSKIYETKEEELQRFNIFKDNLIRAKELQASEKPNGAMFGVTQFMDLTPSEFSSMYLTTRIMHETPSLVGSVNDLKHHEYTPNPVTWDWGSVGAVTPVQDQGACGDPYAFAVTETVESYWFLAGNKLIPLSNEQIVDCETLDGTQGCNGGYSYLTYEYVAKCGLESNQSYPYKEGQGSCAYNPEELVAGISGYVNITTGETGMYKQLSAANNGGPISVCVDATAWEMYTGGVLTQCSNQVNHCAQVTGYANYGTNEAYWIVRNQWGASWGEQGYIYIAIGENLCSISNYASIPIVAPPPNNPNIEWCSGSS